MRILKDMKTVARQWFVNNHPLVQQWEREGVSWCMHHWDKTLLKCNPKRYNMWLIDDLVPVTKCWHMKLHNSGEGNPMYGKYHTEESKALMSANQPDKHGVNNPNYGKPLTDEQKQKLRNAQTGKKHTQDWKNKHSEQMSGSGNPMYGKPASTRKVVLQYTKDGIFVAQHDCIRNAAKSVSGNDSVISNCCHGKINSAYGYVWRFKSEVVK